MQSHYAVADTSEIITPALVVFRDLVESNIDRMIAMAGDASRLRPHCKTHKMREVIELQLARGVAKHKAATFAEAEMLADAGVNDVLLAYNLVGPNIGRAVRFVERYSGVSFAVTADHPQPVKLLSRAMSAAGRSVEVLLDIDTGQHRTGLPTGDAAFDLYRRIADSPGLITGGLHVYDGQNHQTDVSDRTAAVHAGWKPVVAFRDRLIAADLPVPRIVAGGTGSFPVYAVIANQVGLEKGTEPDCAQHPSGRSGNRGLSPFPAIELSPGTCVFHDAGYGGMFPDLEFTPAALLLTRVISRPTLDRLTLDLGYKAVASDPPAGTRVVFPDLPQARQVLQNEEHLVLQSPEAERFSPGDELWAIPRHVCPTTALHMEAYVVSEGKLAARWRVVARDRWLTV